MGSSSLTSIKMGSLSADQLVTKLKQIQGKLTDSERKAADKVVQNFVDLNEDMPTLRNLQRNNLYRNYIWREVNGIGSTGLREESYDVVVTSGGFSSHAMSPNDITETLRILRPEGVMIWSQKTAQAEHSTEFGLFEQNLTSLVKAGKCTLVKHEIFCDARNKSVGELYVVRRLAGRFPDYLDRPTPKELQE